MLQTKNCAVIGSLMTSQVLKTVFSGKKNKTKRTTQVNANNISASDVVLAFITFHFVFRSSISSIQPVVMCFSKGSLWVVLYPNI